MKGLATSGSSTLPVVRGRELVGLLTAENAMEFLILQGAARRATVT